MCAHRIPLQISLWLFYWMCDTQKRHFDLISVCSTSQIEYTLFYFHLHSKLSKSCQFCLGLFMYDCPVVHPAVTLLPFMSCFPLYHSHIVLFVVSSTRFGDAHRINKHWEASTQQQKAQIHHSTLMHLSTIDIPKMCFYAYTSREKETKHTRKSRSKNIHSKAVKGFLTSAKSCFQSKHTLFFCNRTRRFFNIKHTASTVCTERQRS